MKIHPNKVKVFFLVAEAVPFIKVGGLGDVAGALPQSIKKIHEFDGNPIEFDFRVAIPYHSGIDQVYKNNSPFAEFSILKSGINVPVKVYLAEQKNLPVYLIDAAPIHNASSVYSLNTLEDGEKYTLFSMATLKFLAYLKWYPDILHVNDWHTALAAYINQLTAGRRRIPISILTLHNLPFMGAGTEESLADFKIPPGNYPDLPDWAQRQPLPLGLASVDKIVAVSPNYAREIQTRLAGCGLDKFFQKHKKHIVGILNGIDTEIWDPANDSFINCNYGKNSLEKKFINKRFLQSELGLSINDRIPLLILVSRMDIQKGVDLVLEGLMLISDLPWQAILLGSGDPILEKKCINLQKLLPRKVRSVVRFDATLAHQLYAGGDILMIPSRYEPCGLTQMIAMRYGCIPVGRKTGGLKDTVIPSPLKKKNGYVFSGLTPMDFSFALKNAMVDFQNEDYWKILQNNAMSKDFSWNNSAKEYVSLYLDLIEDKKD